MHSTTTPLTSRQLFENAGLLYLCSSVWIKGRLHPRYVLCFLTFLLTMTAELAAESDWNFAPSATATVFHTDVYPEADEYQRRSVQRMSKPPSLFETSPSSVHLL